MYVLFVTNPAAISNKPFFFLFLNIYNNNIHICIAPYGRNFRGALKIKLSKNNDHNGVSHGVKCSQEGDRIHFLESNGQSLEQEHRLLLLLFLSPRYEFPRVG